MATDQETTAVLAAARMGTPLIVIVVLIKAMVETIRPTTEIVPMATAISPVKSTVVLVSRKIRDPVVLTVRHPMILDPETASRQEMDPTARTGISPVEASRPLQVAMMATVHQEVEDRLISVHSLMRMIMIR